LAEVAVLGQDEPNPVPALPARAQLGQRRLVNAAGLRLDEALQVERVVTGRLWRRGAQSLLSPPEPLLEGLAAMVFAFAFFGFRASLLDFI
jgi:hypothetical protein